MTDMPEPAATRRRSGSAWIWLAAGLILAVGATAALVLSDDIRWLRVGIVAALWAALLAAVLAAAHRRRAEVTAESSSQRQRIYELELEKEVAARHEYELEVENRVRAEVTAQAKSDVDALRTELATLRNTLEQLFGAEVTYERVALTAQATRMRAVDKKYSPSGAFAAIRGRAEAISAGQRGMSGSDEPTQFMSRVLEPEQDQHESAFSYATEPAKREPVKQQPAEVAEPKKKQPAKKQTQKKQTEKTKTAKDRSTGERPVAKAAKPKVPKAAAKAKAQTTPVEKTAASKREADQHDADRGNLDFPDQTDAQKAVKDQAEAETPEQPKKQKPLDSPASQTLPALSQTYKSQNSVGFTDDWTPSWERDEADAEPADTVNGADEASGERPHRRRADLPLEDAPIGKHSSNSGDDDTEPAEESSGSHSSGRSVSDLLAALGTGSSPRRHRRRS